MPRRIPVREVQQTLLDASAYIMPLYDVKPDDAHFQEIQRITATGILKTQGEAYHWANRTWFYPDSHITVGEFYEGLKMYHYPVADESDDAPLTIGKCLEILSLLKEDDMVEKVKNEWESISQRPYQPEAPATKREIAVLLDRVLNPFGMQIDHHGFLMGKGLKKN